MGEACRVPGAAARSDDDERLVLEKSAEDGGTIRSGLDRGSVNVLSHLRKNRGKML